MPSSPAPPCSLFPCPERKPCPVHGKASRASRQAYDEARGTAAQRGYDARHRRWRTLVLAEHPVCVDPDGRHPSKVVPSTVADHVVPLRAWATGPVGALYRLAQEVLTNTLAMRGVTVRYPDGLGPWSLENGQGLCASCHAVKTRRENG